MEEGIIYEKDKIAPGYISLKNPMYLEKDGKYYSGFFINNYPHETDENLFIKLLSKNNEIKISLFFEKQDFYDTIKKLTYHIGNIGVDLKDSGENREDIDLIAYSYNDARYIRKEMQIKNEDMYFIYMYITISADSEMELEANMKSLEEICIGLGLNVKRAYFRQEEIYKVTKPFFYQNDILKRIGRRNILTEGMKCLYPFMSTRVVDKDGILVGNVSVENSLIILDRFDKSKYKNSNIAIFGMSGAGKSFFTKMMILRTYMKDVEQLIIDPEREYENLCKNLNGEYIKLGPTSKNFINIFDIREEDLEEEFFFEIVIDKVKSFILLILGKEFEKEISTIEELIVNTYKKKGITDNKESLYKVVEGKRIFKLSTDMPILENFYELVKENKKYKKYEEKLYPYIKGSMKFFNNYTNVNLNNKLIVADIFDLGEDNLIYGMFLCTTIFWNNIKKDRLKKKSIYIDEIWRLIGVSSNKYVASFVYKLFKTIRKYSGSAVAITQDISDLFSLEDGKYGKCIINNTSFKYIFSLEEENLNVLKENLDICEKEKNKIKSLNRGECLGFIEKDRFFINIISSDYEKEMIE